MKINSPLRGAALGLLLAGFTGVAQAAPVYIFKTPIVGFKGSASVLELSPGALTFSDALVGSGPAAAAFLVSNRSAQPISLGVSQLGGEAAFSLSNLCPTPLLPQQTCTLGVSFMPIERGLASTSIRVSAGSEVQTVEVTGRGLQGVLQADTASLAFGPVALGASSAPQELSISNIGDGPVSGVSLDGPALPFALVGSCGPLPPGGACALSLTFTPSESGSASGTVSLASPVGSLSVALTGSGFLNESIAHLASSASVAFGEHEIGAAVTPQAIEVRNTGGIPLTLTGVTNLPQGVSLSANSCVSVVPEATCLLTFSLNTVQELVISQAALTTGANTNASIPMSGLVGNTRLVPDAEAHVLFPTSEVSGNPEEQVIVLRNPGVRPANVTGVAGLPAAVTLQDNGCSGVPAGSTCELRFSMDRTAPVSFSDVVISTVGLNVNTTFTMSGQAVPMIEYAIWDPTKLTAGNQLTNNNLSYSFGPQFGVAISNTCQQSGQYYWEVQITGAQDPAVGVAAKSLVGAARTSVGFGTAGGHASYMRGGRRYLNSNTDVAFGATYTVGDVIGVALNATAGRVWFSKNGVWQAGNPGAGTGGLQMTSVGSAYCPTFGYAGQFGPGGQSVVGAATANFGKTPFSYEVPAGFTRGIPQ